MGGAGVGPALLLFISRAGNRVRVSNGLLIIAKSIELYYYLLLQVVRYTLIPI